MSGTMPKSSFPGEGEGKSFDTWADLDSERTMAWTEWPWARS